jgi:hypothetical protein
MLPALTLPLGLNWRSTYRYRLIARSGGIDADSLALDQAMRGQTSEYPGEDLVVDFERQAATAAAS